MWLFNFSGQMTTVHQKEIHLSQDRTDQMWCLMETFWIDESFIFVRDYCKSLSWNWFTCAYYFFFLPFILIVIIFKTWYFMKHGIEILNIERQEFTHVCFLPHCSLWCWVKNRSRIWLCAVSCCVTITSSSLLLSLSLLYIRWLVWWRRHCSYSSEVRSSRLTDTR